MITMTYLLLLSMLRSVQKSLPYSLDSDAVYLVVAGDFNCSVNSRLYGAYCDFLNEEKLLCVD